MSTEDCCCAPARLARGGRGRGQGRGRTLPIKQLSRSALGVGCAPRGPYKQAARDPAAAQHSTAHRPAGAGLRGPTRHRKLPRKAEGLSRVGPRSAAGRKIIPHAFTFPGALAAAGWGLPGLWGTGESREQGHVPARRQ